MFAVWAVLTALLIAGLNGYLLVSVLRDPGSLSIHGQLCCRAVQVVCGEGGTGGAAACGLHVYWLVSFGRARLRQHACLSSCMPAAQLQGRVGVLSAYLLASLLKETGSLSEHV